MYHHSNIPEYVFLCLQILPHNVSNLAMLSHLLVNEHLFVRAQVTNQSLGYIVTVDLVSQLTNQSLALFLHLFNFALGKSETSNTVNYTLTLLYDNLKTEQFMYENLTLHVP